MIINKLNSRQRLLAVVALILLLMAAYRYFPGSWPAGSGGDLEMRETRLLNLQRRVRKKEALATRLTALARESARLESVLLNGRTPALAAVDLQNRLADLAGRAGVEIGSQRVIPPPRGGAGAGALKEISVRITLETGMRQLRDILHGIAASPVLMRVSELDLAVRGKTEGVVRADLLVTGLMAVERRPEEER